MYEVGIGVEVVAFCADCADSLACSVEALGWDCGVLGLWCRYDARIQGHLAFRYDVSESMC
jgi:hypothetical protein